MTYSPKNPNSPHNPFVTIRICHEMTEAQVLRGLLEQHDIPTIIDNEHISSAIPSFTMEMTLPVKVHAEDEQRARLLLDNVQPLTSNRPYHPIELEECPACGSSQIIQYGKFFSWLLGFNKPDVEGAYHRCMACDHRWRAVGTLRENSMLLALFGGIATFGFIWLLLYIIGWLKYNL